MNRKLRQFLTSSSSAFVAAALLTVASPVRAGDVLFVSDSLTDAINIPFVLSGGSAEVDLGSGVFFREAVTADDHDVTIIRNDYVVTNPVQFAAEGTNPALAGGEPLSFYCAVFWSASGPHEPDLFGAPLDDPPIPPGVGADGGLHTDANVFTNLDAYVAGGGYVFVTGHDAATDPMDPLVEEFVGGVVGGVGAIAVQQHRNPPNLAPFGTVSAANNALGSGVVGLDGLTPGGLTPVPGTPGGVKTVGTPTQDLDYIAGMDLAEVTGVVDEPMAAGGFMWTERVPAANGGAAAGSDMAQGRIAYVANGIFLFEDLPFNPGVFLSDGEDVSWLDDEVYNGALRNFAFNGCAAIVPDVVGLPQAAAEAAIVAAELTVGTVTTANSAVVPTGDVISQNPVGGTALAPNSEVDIVVSLGPVLVTVPDVTGLPQATAEAAIVAADLVVGTVTTANSNVVPTGDVISQNPVGGTSAALGSAVDIVVSLGPVLATVPNVVGLPQATAEGAIVAAGLAVGTVTTANSNVVPAGDVISQNPAAGTSVAPGSAVDIEVSLGPVVAPLVCDVEPDGDVDRLDIMAIFAARNQPADVPFDPRDADGDGVITVLDGRQCVLQCTLPACAIIP